MVAPPAQLMSAATPSEVGVAGVKLLGGGSVLRVGQPRLRTARTFGNLACRTAAGRLFASDRNVVRQWDAVTGVVLSTLRTTWDADISAPMVVASEARHFAVRTGDGAGLGATGAGLFTRDSKTPLVVLNAFYAASFGVRPGYLAGADDHARLVDVSTGVVTAVSGGRPRLDPTLAMYPHKDSVWWLTSGGVLLWHPESAQVDPAMTAAKPWREARVATSAPRAAITDDKQLFVLDLETLATTRMADRAWSFDISRTGSRVVYSSDAVVHVVDASSGAEVTSFDAGAYVQELAYCDEADVIAYRTESRVHLYRLGTGEVRYPDPTRFLGWTGPEQATLATPSGLQVLHVSDGAVAGDPSGTDAPVPAPAPPVTVTPTNVVIRRSGSRPVAIPLRSEQQDKDHIRTYQSAALSPDGTRVAVVWARSDLYQPNPSRYPDDDLGTFDPCRRQTMHGCAREFYAELWALPARGDKARRTWQVRFEYPDPRATPIFKAPPKEYSGAITFTHDNQRVLFGFDDGEIQILAAATGAGTSEMLHDAPVIRLEVAPGDGFVLSEDTVGEQLIWKLAP